MAPYADLVAPVTQGGTYYVNATVTMELPTGNVTCALQGNSASATSTDVTASSPTSVAQVTVPVTGAVSVNAGSDITVVCTDTPGPTAEVYGDYESSSFTALLVANSTSVG
ncbi:MAG TPA: hypothetical protein VMU95_11660 [Trebonia sp.]|nr:hypothetical protein [Trebonia sp.]